MARTLPTHDPGISANPAAPDLKTLGRLVRNQRALTRAPVGDAAMLSGVSADVLSRLENGKPVTTEKLLHVLDGLGLALMLVPKDDAPHVLKAYGESHSSASTRLE